MIEPSTQQQEVIRKAVAWATNPKRRRPFFRIEGFAGSGKTFVIQHIIKALPEEIRVRTQYCAPTGKAALVMQSYGCFGATTIHKKIYTPNGDRRAKPEEIAELKKQLDDHVSFMREQGFSEDHIWLEDREASKLQSLVDQAESKSQPCWKINPDSDLVGCKLLVVSEASMVDSQMGKDLLSFNVPILLEGDPGQLPPVAGDSYFMKGPPDGSLSQIHRQAEGSPILELARLARMGSPIPYGDYGQGCAVVKKISAELAMQADQIIVGRNATRHKKNHNARAFLGFIDGTDRGDDVFIPKTGEKLICLRNDNEAGLLNGSFWKCITADRLSDSKLRISIESEDDSGDTGTYPCHFELFKGENQKSLPQWALRQKGIQQFDWGYAVTCHKAQGSQWPFVVVYDEGDQFAESRKWRYTAFTRPRERLVIVRP